MIRYAPLLDRLINAGLVFLLVFTPLAFGAVSEWAQAVAQFVISVVLAAWVVKTAWGPAPMALHLDPEGEPDSPPSRRRRRGRGLFGGRVLLSGIEGPALLFALVVLLQVAPLPAAWVAAVSPKAAELQRHSRPIAGDGRVAGLESWLLGPDGMPDGEVTRLPPPAPGRSERSLAADQPLPGSRQPFRLSLAPAATWRHLSTFLGYLAAFMVGVNHWRDRRHADRALLLVGAMAGLLAVFAILQQLTWNGALYWLWPSDQAGSPFGPFINRNHFAGYLEMGLPVAIGLAFASWHRTRHEDDPTERVIDQQERHLPRLVLLGAGAAFGAIALLASGSRGGLLAAAGAATVFLLAAPLRRAGGWRPAVAALALAGLAAGAAWGLGGERLWNRYSSLADPSGDPSFAFRLDTARRTLGMAIDFPVVGVGLGAFSAAYPMYVAGGRVNRTGAAHNDYAELAAETGVVGCVLAFAGLLIFALRFLLPALVRTGSPRRHVIHGLAVGMLAMLLHSFYDFNLQVYSNGLLFVLLGALLAADRLSRLPRGGSRA